jgi:hypothetical protein
VTSPPKRPQRRHRRYAVTKADKELARIWVAKAISVAAANKAAYTNTLAEWAKRHKMNRDAQEEARKRNAAAAETKARLLLEQINAAVEPTVAAATTLFGACDDVCLQVGGGGGPAKRSFSSTSQADVSGNKTVSYEEQKAPYGTRISPDLCTKVFRFMLPHDKPGTRHKGASDFVKVRYPTYMEVTQAIQNSPVDIDFVSITGPGSKLLHDERIREMLSGGTFRIFSRATRDVCRRSDGGLILTIGVFSNWVLGKPLDRGHHSNSFEEYDDADDQVEETTHLRRFIDVKLKNFEDYFTATVIRPYMFSNLADHFGSLELTLYRVGAKHDVTSMIDPPRSLVHTIETLSKDFKVDCAIAMTLKIDSFYMGVDKEGFHARNRFQFSNQEPVNNVLLPDGDDRVKSMYRLCIYNDMIHHPLLKDRANQEIELKHCEPKNGQETVSLLQLALPSMMANLENLEDVLFKPSPVSKKTMLQSNGLRFEMYFDLKEQTPVAMLKRQMETYISETAIITMISVEDVSKFINVRFATWKNVTMEIQRDCLTSRRNPNCAEIFLICRIYTQLVEGLLHKQRCNDIRETDKYNVGYMTEAC